MWKGDRVKGMGMMAVRLIENEGRENDQRARSVRSFIVYDKANCGQTTQASE